MPVELEPGNYRTNTKRITTRCREQSRTKTARVDHWRDGCSVSLPFGLSSSAFSHGEAQAGRRLSAGLPLWNHVVNAECSPAILMSVCLLHWVEHCFGGENVTFRGSLLELHSCASCFSSLSERCRQAKSLLHETTYWITCPWDQAPARIEGPLP
ncbi:hypothetical protein V8C26DRAFT_385661 [Trichoderma gracile]